MSVKNNVAAIGFNQALLKSKVNPADLTDEQKPAFERMTGLCFRLTVKWAVCTLVGGKFVGNPLVELATREGLAELLADAQSQAKYREGSAGHEQDLLNGLLRGFTIQDCNMETAGQAVTEYATSDRKRQKTFIKAWGAMYTDNEQGVHGKVYVAGKSDQDVSEYLRVGAVEPPYAIIFTVYGFRKLNLPKQPLWGHTVGMCTRDYTHWEKDGQTVAGPVLFDSNSGWFDFAGGDGVGEDMVTYMNWNKKGWTKCNTILLKIASG